MGKKILKRSLVIGLLMAFVITGNAWAGESYLPQGEFSSNDAFMDKCDLDFYYGGYSSKYYFYYPKESFSNNVVATSGDLDYRVVNAKNISCNFFPTAGFFNTKNYKNDVVIDNNTLKVLHNLYSKVYMEITGGYLATGSTGGLSKVINNKVLLNTTIDKANRNLIEISCREGSIFVSGGFSNENAPNAQVVYNRVSVANTKFLSNSTLEIYGGYAKDGIVYENIVEIYNCILPQNSYMFGGSAVIKGDVKNNHVSISNVVLQSASLYGGYSNNGEVSGNILNVKGKVTGTANLISNFGKINYDNLNWDAKGIAIKTNELDLDDSGRIKVNVNGLSEGSIPKKGEVMTLLDTDTVMLSGDETFESQYLEESTSTFNSGNFLKAEGKIYQENKDIKLKITRVGTNDQALVIGESRAAATAFTNQGSELIEIGLDSLARDKSEKETKVFASIFGNASEYATGSHIKVNGWSGIVGVAKTNDDGLTKGAFFENGEGNYRTFNNFKGDFMRGDGEANYNGGGFFVRKDNSNGVYTEASLRAGNLQNELHKAIVGSEGLAGYDIDTFYYGAHLGVGKIIPRGNEGDSIDIYGKFIYTHHDSEDFTIDGDEFHFDSVDSERLRLGFRINEMQNKKLNMYYGAAWEYEFGGDADNTVVSYDLSTPSLSGSTVIGEIGMHYKASEKWSVDINGRAYTGQRDGFTGSVQANYAF